MFAREQVVNAFHCSRANGFSGQVCMRTTLPNMIADECVCNSLCECDGSSFANGFAMHVFVTRAVIGACARLASHHDGGT